MPDQLPSAILDSTNSFDSIFALDLDTKQRFDNILNQQQRPIDYPIPDYNKEFTPQGLPQDDLLNPQKMKGTLGEALFSQDPRVADYAVAKMRIGQSKLPVSQGIGVPDRFEYSKAMDKFLSGDYGYNPYMSLEDNEDFNYRYDYLSQNVFERAFKNTGVGLSRFVSSVALKLGQTVGYLGSMVGNGIQEIYDREGNNFMADVADNSLSRWFEGIEEDMKNSNLLSVFKPRGWEDKGFFQKLGNGAFWTDEVADGAAFMGEMVASMYLMGGLGKIGAVGRLGATEINLTKALGRLGPLGRYTGKTLDFALKTATGADNLSGIGRWAFATTSESAFEASQLYKTRKDELKARRMSGDPTYANMSDEEIETIAGDSAAASFKANMLILSASNAFENRFIFNPLFRRLGASSPNPKGRLINVNKGTGSLEELAQATRKEYKYATWLGKKLDWKNSNSRLRFYGGRGLSATAAEGFWEENAQLAVERLSGVDNLSFSTFTEKLKNQTIGAIQGTDPEAQTNIGLGALIGLGGTGIVSKVRGGDKLFQGERRKIEQDTFKAVTIYENARRNFLNFQDIYVRDPQTNKPIKDEYGNLQIDPAKAAGMFDGINAFTSKQEAASKANDPLFRKHLQDSAMMDYVVAAKNAGIFSRATNRFNSLGDLTQAELENLGFDPATTVDTVYLRDSLNQFGKIYDSVENSPAARRGKNDTIEDELNRKHALYKASASAYSAGKLINEFQSKMLDRDFPSAFSPEAEGNTSEIQAYNSLIFQKEGLEQWAELAKEHGTFYNEFLKEQKRSIDAEMQRLEAILDNMIATSNLNIRVTPRGFVVSDSKYDYLRPTLEDQGTGTLKQMTIAMIRNSAKNRSALIQEDINMDIENTAQRKHAQYTNERSRDQYLVAKFSNLRDGIGNYKDYMKFYDSMQKKDAEAEAQQAPPPTTGPTPTATAPQPAAPTTAPVTQTQAAPVVASVTKNEAVDSQAIISTLTGMLSTNYTLFVAKDTDTEPDFKSIASYIDEKILQDRKAVESVVLNFVRDTSEPVIANINNNTLDVDNNTALDAYNNAGAFIESIIENVQDAELNLQVLNHLEVTDNAIQNYKPTEVELTPQENAAIEALGPIDASTSRLAPYTAILQDPSASNQNKKEALRYISDQLLDPKTGDEIGVLLGRRASEAIEELGYPVPTTEESNDFQARLAETEKENTVSDLAERAATLQAFIDRVVAGEQMTSPADLQFYENNRNEIESALKTRAQQPTLAPQTPSSLAPQVKENKSLVEPRALELFTYRALGQIEMTDEEVNAARAAREYWATDDQVKKFHEIYHKYVDNLTILPSEQRHRIEREIASIEEERAEIQKELEDVLKLKDLQEQLRQKAVEEAQKITEEEKTELAQELSIAPEMVPQAVAEVVTKELVTHIEEPAPKDSLFRRIVNRIKRILLTLFAAGTLWTGAGGTSIQNGNIDWSANTLIERSVSPLAEEQQQWAKRFLEKHGVYESKDAVLAVTESLDDTIAPVEINEAEDSVVLVKPTLEILGTVPDSYNPKDSLISYRSTWDNSEGFEYVPGPNRGQGKTITSIPGVIGVGHFLLDGSVFGGKEYSHPYNTNFLKRARENNDYIPAFQRLENGNVLLKYKKPSNILASDVVVSPLRQFKAADVSWATTGSVKGFARTVKEIKKKSGEGTNLIFKDANGYSRFSGGSVVFIFQKGPNTIVVDFAGSINMIKNEANRIQREYDVKPEDLTIGYHDVGSFSAKPKAKNGTIYTSQYSGYNNSDVTGGSLLIPIDPVRNNIPESIMTIFPLLAFVRRRRQEGEALTDTDVKYLRDMLDTLDDRLAELRYRLSNLPVSDPVVLPTVVTPPQQGTGSPAITQAVPTESMSTSAAAIEKMRQEELARIDSPKKGDIFHIPRYNLDPNAPKQYIEKEFSSELTPGQIWLKDSVYWIDRQSLIEYTNDKYDADLAALNQPVPQGMIDLAPTVKLPLEVKISDRFSKRYPARIGQLDTKKLIELANLSEMDHVLPASYFKDGAQKLYEDYPEAYIFYEETEKRVSEAEAKFFERNPGFAQEFINTIADETLFPYDTVNLDMYASQAAQAMLDASGLTIDNYQLSIFAPPVPPANTQAGAAAADTEGSGVQETPPPPPAEPPAPPVPAENSDESSLAQENYIDVIVDTAKINGRFAFPQNMPAEVVMEGDKAKITNGAIQLKTTVGDQQNQMLRQHNILKVMGERSNPVNFWSVDDDDKPLYKVRLEVAGIRNEVKYAPWVYNTAKGLKNPVTGKPYGFPFIIAMVVDQEGNYVYFDDQGRVSDKLRGKPFGFPYTVEDYKSDNLGISRRGVQLGTMEPLNGVAGYLNDNPLQDLTDALQRGVEIIGTIDTVASGKLSTYNVDNQGSTWAKEPQRRTVAQMEADGDINDTATLVLTSGQYFEYSSETTPGSPTQKIKVGQPYLFDDRSGMKIPLRGKLLKDLTIDGKPFISNELKEVVETLSKEKRFSIGEIVNPERQQFMEDLFNTLRALVYSNNTPVFINDDKTVISILDQRPDNKSLMETEVNYSTNISIITNPFDTDSEGYSYDEFVKENFLSGAVPAQLTKDHKGFEKLNRRIIFTLDKDHQQILDSIGAKADVSKTIRMKMTDFSKFVNKTYRKRGGTSTITVTGYSDGKFTIAGPSGTVTQSTEDFMKSLKTLEEVTLPTPTEEVQQDFENNIKLSEAEEKELNERAKNISNEDLDNIDFNC